MPRAQVPRKAGVKLLFFYETTKFLHLFYLKSMSFFLIYIKKAPYSDGIGGIYTFTRN